MHCYVTLSNVRISTCYIDMLLLQNGRTVLHIACIGGYTEMVKHLINDNAADVSATDDVSNYALAVFIIELLDLITIAVKCFATVYY